MGCADRWRRVVPLLTRWGKKNGRHFPWRETSDPYQVLVAEILLQRTRGEQTVEVYRRFLSRFPTPMALDKAPVDGVQKIVGTLGFARRARLLRELGEALVENHAGRVPRSRNDLMALPGVGHYGADSTLCFGFGEPRAVIDANVVRVISRVCSRRYDRETHRKAWVRRVVDTALEVAPAREYNYAVLDLGATVCTARSPRCEICPLRHHCLTGQLVLQQRRR